MIIRLYFLVKKVTCSEIFYMVIGLSIKVDSRIKIAGTLLCQYMCPQFLSLGQIGDLLYLIYSGMFSFTIYFMILFFFWRSTSMRIRIRSGSETPNVVSMVASFCLNTSDSYFSSFISSFNLFQLIFYFRNSQIFHSLYFSQHFLH